MNIKARRVRQVIVSSLLHFGLMGTTVLFQMFQTNYDTSSDKFQNYYKDVSLRMKNKKMEK